MLSRVIIAVLTVTLLTSCNKDESEVVPDNTAPVYNGVPTVSVQNYVNRLFIDLIGREPLDTEMDIEVAALKSAELGAGAREALVTKLMTNTDFIQGDSSYRNAYYRRLYELCKARTMEAASDAEIDFYIGLETFGALSDSLAGDSAAFAKHMNEIAKMERVKTSWQEYMAGSIECDELLKRMIFNRVYDEINMNSFNYINASFDDLFQRYPTQSEFDDSYNMVDANQPSVLFGQSGTNKKDYADILVETQEFYEGMIRWCYTTYLAREASTAEVYQIMNSFWTDHDLQKVQKGLLITDEYANFD
jgi:hypothetical protein